MQLRQPIAIVALLSLMPLAAVAQNAARITVTGSGVVYAAPDSAQFRVGANVARGTAREALDEANRVVTALHQALDRAGLEDKHRRTVQFQVSPQYAPRQRGGEPAPVVGYRVLHLLSVTTVDIEGLGDTMDGLVSVGANVMENVRFINQDPVPMLDDARRKAVNDGARRARLLADAAGKALGPLVVIREGIGVASPAPMLRAERVMAASVPVAPGQNEYRASVTLEYQLR